MSRAIYRPSGEVIGRPKRGGLYMWGLAVLVGVLAAMAVAAIQALVMYAQFVAFRAPSGRLSSQLTQIPWWVRLIVPIVGGALICLLLRLGISWGWGRRRAPSGCRPSCRTADCAGRYVPRHFRYEMHSFQR